jgi:hypothetical protein
MYTYRVTDGVQTVKYQKAQNNQAKGNLDLATEYLINKGIVIGNYILVDSSNVNTMVSFSPLGKIDGWGKYKSYSINYDFATGPMNNLDEIAFDGNTDNWASFTFKINADTLNIYEYHADADSVEMIRGSLKYKLVRKSR